MTVRPLLALVVAATVVAALAGARSSAGAGTWTGGGAACRLDVAGHGGYTYAGHQATRKGHGVRATITAVRAPSVGAGHVAGWVGLGGPGQGPNGTDMWLQAGLASMPGWGTVLYAEVARPGAAPEFLLLEEDVAVGDSRRVAVLEMSRRPEWWRIWVNGVPVTGPIHLSDSSERWAPIATAESWNGGERGCNRFAFRFERVSVSHGRGGSWFAFRPGYDFRDGHYRLRSLASAPPVGTAARRLVHGDGPLPYAFLAASS